MSQASGTQASGKPGGKKGLWLVSIVLVVVALGAGIYSYVGVTPHTVTLTSTSYATNTSVITSTSTLVSVSTNTFTNVVTTTATAPAGNLYIQQNCSPSNCQQQPCYYNGCGSTQGYCYWNDCDFNVCQSSGTSSTQCSGYLYQAPNGCVELVIPIGSPVAQPSFQFYTLQDLPSSLPSFGSWVTVTGQVYLGSNTASNGAACPGNYIVVTSIS